MDGCVKVVISGTAGAFPDCENVAEFEKALDRKAFLITEDERKWQNPNSLPMYHGNAFGSDKFDATFFNVHFQQPPALDPITRKGLETAVEAIIDAGVCPRSLAGSNTAVFTSYDVSEMESSFAYVRSSKVFIGIARTMSANRLSFSLNLNGPSLSYTGGWAALFFLLENAREQLERGSIDAAVIVCSNYIMTQQLLVCFSDLGMTSPDGKCRPFDTNGQGYARGDGCVAFFLQRERDARRNWATVIASDYRYFKVERANALTFDKKNAMDVLENLYRKHNINPAHIEYIEADGSGLQDRDGKEVEAIIDFFCKDRSRSSKLLIGSCKSNIGHLDTAAPAASVVKTIFALNKCKVPPTINHTSPIPELAQSNDVQVVTSATPCDGNLMGVNGISLWGGFGHIILQGNPRKTSKMKISEKFPQILLLSSRTEEGIDQILRKVKTVKITPEFAALSNDVFSKGIKFHMHRGYTIVNPEATQIPHKIQTVDIHDRPLWYVFSGMGSQWAGMGSQLLHIPVFRAAIERCDQVLKPHGVDLLHIITTPDEAIFDNILNCFVGITAIQIGLIDVMRVLKLEPDGMIGHSVGELGCAYADNCLTLEQTILSAFLRGKASLEATLIKGMMAAIGIGYHDIVKILPPTIDVACRNSASSCTLSGPAEDVEAFVKQLKAKGIFAKAVNVANIAYHSRYIQPAGPILLKYLKQVIQKETSRSSKWVSTSIPEHRWDTELALYSSAEYLANNLLSPVLFEDVLKHIPPNAVMVEIAPHGLLQAILKRAVPNVNLALAKRTKSEDAVKFLLEAIGQLYLLGFEPDVVALYPPIQYPVPADTPNLQQFVTWEHTESYPPPEGQRFINQSMAAKLERSYFLEEIQNALLACEKTGSPILALSFFLTEVWDILAKFHRKSFDELPVQFEDLQLLSSINHNGKGFGEILIQILPGTGDFSVFQEWVQERDIGYSIEVTTVDETTPSNMILTGRIKVWEKPKKPANIDDRLGSKNIEKVQNGGQDKHFSDGIALANGLKTKAISNWQLCDQGLTGKLKWDPNWTIYLDTAVRLNILRDLHITGRVVEPVSIQSISVNPTVLRGYTKGSKINFFVSTVVRHLECDGITIYGLKTAPVIEKVKNSNGILTERVLFVSYGETTFKNPHEFLRASLQTIVENSRHATVTTADTPLKIHISGEKCGRLAASSPDIFSEVLRSKDNNLYVEFVPDDSLKINGSTAGSHLSILSDLKSVPSLTSWKNCDDDYLLTITPAQIQMKDVKQAARSFGNHYAVIYEQVFASIRYGFLKKRNHPKQYRICHLSENALSSLGAMNLQENSERGESVILVVQKLPPANPIITIQRILRESGKIGLKCHLYLMLDDNVPSFSLDNNLYREQIDREMTVNVLRKGKWGSYYKLPVPKSIHEEVDQLVTFVNHPTEVDLKFIGLNPVVRELGKEEASTVLDYSGISLSGHNVMGIAYKPKGFGRNLSLDPIFQWTVPPSFPLIGAAALPSAYLMAHVIMDKILRVPIKKTAFILNGQTPIGIACISLCLNMGYDVFATVPNKAARKLLMILFPEMSESHITDHNNEDFYVPVMFATGGIGADIIISDLPRRQMLVAWKCIGEFGCFVNLNEETMDHNAPLPMGRFNECNGYYSFKQSSLKDLPKEHKLRLHALVSESLASGRIVHIPHQILDTDNLNQLPRSVELITEQGGKLILDVSNDCTGKKTHKPTREKRNGLNGHSEWIANGDAHQTYIILTETAGKAVNIIDWLLERGVKKIVMATLDMRGGESAIRKINNSTIKHDAMFLMVSNDMMKTASGVKKLLGKAERLGKISTILAISLDEHVDILSNVGDELKQLKNDCSLINIQAATSTYESDDMVTIVCSDDVDCSHALGQAMTDPDKTATYVVSSKIENRLSDSAPGACEKLTDYLPSSIHELEEMGADLCLRDSQIYIRNSAEFLYTPSLSPRTATEIDDVLPVFIVPAFCQTQLKPLISKLIYPCYVAHVHPEAGSTEQVASHLLESMLKIQRRGPYTLVGETWSGGLAILLAKLLTDAKLEVSLFLLQGVPQRFLSLLPPRESLNAHLIKLLFELDDEKNPEVFEEPDETKRLDKVVESLPFNKDFLRRSFKAIQRQIESLNSSQDHSISLNNDIFLMEVSRFCKLSVIEVETMSEKRGQLVKIDCENYKKMLSNPQLSAKIAEEAPFTW